MTEKQPEGSHQHEELMHREAEMYHHYAPQLLNQETSTEQKPAK